MSRLSEEHPKAKDEGLQFSYIRLILPKIKKKEFSDLSLSNDYDKYNFDEIFPKWMDQLRADWEALNSLCAEMEVPRAFEIFKYGQLPLFTCFPNFRYLPYVCHFP